MHVSAFPEKTDKIRIHQLPHQLSRARNTRTPSSSLQDRTYPHSVFVGFVCPIVRRVRSVVINENNLSDLSQSGRERDESVVQSEHIVELSRNSNFFLVPDCGYVVL
jgi:hypothetical protein